jgi:hypothetical protein
MSSKKEQKAPVVVAKVVDKQVAKPKPVVAVKKEYPKQNVSVFDIEKPIKTNEAGETTFLELKDAINYYEKEFIKSVCQNREFLDYNKNVKSYLINPRTGYPYTDFSMQFKYNKTSNIEYNGKYINITRYLDNLELHKKIIGYYQKLGFHCEIFKTGYNEYTDRYSGVMILVKW